MTRRAADLGALERRLVAVWAEQHGAHCGDDIALALGTRVSIDSAGEVFDARDGSTPDALLAELRASRPHLFKTIEPTSTTPAEPAHKPSAAPGDDLPAAPRTPDEWTRTLRAIGDGRAADAPAMAAPSPVARSVPPGDGLDVDGLPIAPTTPQEWRLILGGRR